MFFPFGYMIRTDVCVVKGELPQKSRNGGGRIYIAQRNRLRFRLYSMCQSSRMSRPKSDGSLKVSSEYERSRSMLYETVWVLP